MDQFLSRQTIDCLFELFSKPNELHQDQLRDVRSRLLCNPSPSMKGVGSYLTRLMIRVMKIVETGFISGYSLTRLSEKMAEARENGEFTGAYIASGDFVGLDSHQHLEHIRTVDHKLINFLVPLICSHSECKVPSYLSSEVIRALTISDYRVFTKTGMKARIIGTVFSGHPTLTTLFNTTRVILYHRFSFWLMNPRLERLIKLWVSGDDFLLYSPVKFSVDFWLSTLGGHGGVRGLGQNLRDVKVGPLEIHTFLSKEFLIDVQKIEFIPVSQRLYKAGTGYNVTCGLTKSEFRTAQWISNSGMHDSISIFRDRFLDGILAPINSKIEHLLKYDWGYKMKLNETLPDPELDSIAFFKTDPSYLFRMTRDLADCKQLTTSFRAGFDVCVLDPCEDPFSKIKMPQRQIKLKTDKKQKRIKLSLIPEQGVRKTRNLVKAYNTTRNSRQSKRSSLLNAWVEDHHNAEFQYAIGLYSPKMKHCTRIPQPLPIATAVAQQRGSLVLQANTSGYIFVCLNPYATSIVNYYNNVALVNDTTVIGTLSSSTTSVMTTSNKTSYRVVSAWLGGVDLTAALSKTGTITMGNIPWSQLSGLAATADTLRDTLWSENVASQQVKSYRGGFFLPMDPSALNFLASGNPIDFEVPFFYCSALVASTNISIEYCVNYEYIPAVGQTDLLATELGKSGSQESALLKVAAIREMKLDSAPTEHGLSDSILEALDLNSASGLAGYAAAGVEGYALGNVPGAIFAGAGHAAGRVYNYFVKPKNNMISARPQQLMIKG
jgi:hypothetical protein